MKEAILIVSFGGPESEADVMPFLENVLRGRNVPRERMLEVAEHYMHFDGMSPINDHNRELIGLLEALLKEQGPHIPVYWGNRNWDPMLPDTVRQMANDGIEKAYAFVTSAYSSYSGCRQYRENIEAASKEVGLGAPEIVKLRHFYNHPGFIDPLVDGVIAGFSQIPDDRREKAALLFTAHSVPISMAEGSRYVEQLNDGCKIVAAKANRTKYKLVYQSRSGPPGQPWLEPDVLSYIKQLHAEGVVDVVVSPIGFCSDHMEVLFDLDVEAKELAAELGMNLIRTKTAGSDPRLVQMIRGLVEERRNPELLRIAIGDLGASPDICPVGCCPAPQRPAARPSH